MLFKKKRKELDSKEIEQIMEEYLKVVKETVGKYLSRRERRVMSRGKSGKRQSASAKNKEIEQIKKKGAGFWLNQTTEDVLSELSSIVPDFPSLESDLRGRLKDFKKKWKIK